MKPDRETVDADTVDQLSTGGERVILQIPRAVPTKTLTPLARSNERCHEPGRVTDTVACAALTAPAETRVKISFRSCIGPYLQFLFVELYYVFLFL